MVYAKLITDRPERSKRERVWQFMPHRLPIARDFEVSPVLANHRYYAPALELARRMKHKPEPSNDEIVTLAVVSTQAAIVEYLQPDKVTAEEALNAIMRIMDNEQVVTATFLKLHKLLRN